MAVVIGEISWERMINAVEAVRKRLLLTASTLDSANLPYAVVGGNAVAAWVSKVDEAAVRNTRDVDILVNRDDFEAIKTAMATAGFNYRHAASIDMFIQPGSKARDAVHVLFAGEKIRSEDLTAAPRMEEAERAEAGFRVVNLEALVRMKLTSYRDKDRMHLRDLLDVELIDQSWLARFPGELGTRLKAILDDPHG